MLEELRGVGTNYRMPRPYVSYCTRMGVVTYARRIMKTYSKLLSENLVNQFGFELLSVTSTPERPKPKYTLWGVVERLGARQKKAIEDGVLMPMGYRRNDESFISFKKEAKEYG